MLNKYLVIKDAIHNIKGFHTTISAHFKQEMFFSWAIDQNHIKHDFLLGLCNFVVNHFCFHSPFSHSSPLSRFKLANENTMTVLFGSLNNLCSAKWNILPLILVFFKVTGRQRMRPSFVLWQPFYNWPSLQGKFMKKLSLKPCMDVLSQTLIQVNDSKVHYNCTEYKWKVHLCLIIVKVFHNALILTSNNHINCLVLWFTKAIVCYTGIIPCITPVDVCYSQHLSFLHHNSIPLVPKLLFGPSDVWLHSTRCFTD